MDDGDALNQRLDEWVAKLSVALGVGREVVDTAQVLALAGEAAHAVARPAAPVTTFMVGYAAGLAAARDRSGSEAVATAVAIARDLCIEVADR